jgi:uncharacterized Zn finger protein
MSPEYEDEPTAAIEYHVGEFYCPHCKLLVPYTLSPDAPSPSREVKVLDVARLKAGWLTQGEYRAVYCPSCGAVMTVLVHQIPIECATFPCPTCGPGAELTIEIINITAIESGYSFVALLKCNACSKQRRLSKILKGLSKITRVKVGPTGVEVEVKP